MPVHDDLGRRMKDFYESVPKIKLVRRMPVIIRIDGKAFHTYTRGFGRPFDDVLMRTMQDTMKYLCENIQGCVLGYTQSDEITLVLVDYRKLNSSAWFDYEVQKMCSVGASMAAMAFNRAFGENMRENPQMAPVYEKAAGQAVFDARCFNIPREEVANLLYWRQLDASRNSIQMAGQACFSQKQLHGKSCSMIQDMLMLEKGINWNDYPADKKRGSCCVRAEVSEEGKGGEALRDRWVIDRDIPIFKGEGRAYIERMIGREEDE